MNLTAAETLLLTLPVAFSENVQVRERQDGAWRVWYPDPGWIACESTCAIKHNHDWELAYIESRYHPTDYEDAVAWAEYMAGSRDIDILKYTSPSKRKRQKVT